MNQPCLELLEANKNRRCQSKKWRLGSWVHACRHAPPILAIAIQNTFRDVEPMNSHPAGCGSDRKQTRKLGKDEGELWSRRWLM
ncbi:hypothetical protein IG631_02243 [Alternaria alternata]|nr:hypothetical protein IG631_02243 [Alternaria alternata]